MTSPSQRRRDPQPLSRGWELAAAGAGGVLIAVVLAALAGLGLAAALWGGGWVWPHGTDTITEVIAGLLHGDPGQGLPPVQRRLVAGPTETYVGVAIAETTLCAGAAVAGVLLSRYLRPGDARSGMATRGEAERALGISQLRSSRAVIRPDLYPSGAERRPRAGGHR